MAIATYCPETIKEEENLGVGPDNRTIKVIQNKLLTRHFFVPVSRHREVSYQFHELASEWKDNTMFTSSSTKICADAAYLRIIGIGQEVIPFIFRDMERVPDHWFVALESLTGADPVRPEHIGSVSEMTKDWLDWARGMGYDW